MFSYILIRFPFGKSLCNAFLKYAMPGLHAIFTSPPLFGQHVYLTQQKGLPSTERTLQNHNAHKGNGNGNGKHGFGIALIQNVLGIKSLETNKKQCNQEELVMTSHMSESIETGTVASAKRYDPYTIR